MAPQKYFEQDRGKLIEVALYLSELSIDDPDFGIEKLAKLLYYADCDAYMHHGEPITGTTYLHFPHGPYPENWHQVRQQMEQQGDVEVIYGSSEAAYQRYCLLPLRTADLERLQPSDREILEAQVSRFAGFNAAGIERYSHQEIGWLSTEDGQPIPYSLAGVSSAQLSPRDIQNSRALS
jgi:hypothetical protein